jgi:ribosomal protein S12 methylthiotransferase
MHELAAALDALARAHRAWVRLHYVYPYPHVDEAIALMTRDPAQGGLLPYLDVPFQHASPRILKLMKRPANAEGTLRRIEAWRAQRPDLVIRSTFIVGFPGETESEFEALLEFLAAAQLDRVGCFAYSPVEGAAANGLPDAVPEEIKEERRARFMAVQERISAQRLARRVGSIATVLVDGRAEDGTIVARSAADAPEIDGTVRVTRAGKVASGDFIGVRVTAADAHDLTATAI